MQLHRGVVGPAVRLRRTRVVTSGLAGLLVAAAAWFLVFAPDRRAAHPRSSGMPAHDEAQLTAARLAAELPHWRSEHPEHPCPSDVADLVPSGEPIDTTDPWGTDYRAACTPDESLVISAGLDGRFDTADDVVGE